ncbi:MAG TPA: hypothetical protein VID28_18755 [Methylomirabilota bacterium]
MARRLRSSRLLGALAAHALVLTAATAVAHPATPLHDAPASAAPAVGQVALGGLVARSDGGLWVVLALVMGVGLLSVAVRGLRGRAIALGLSLVLAVFALESAVHSVHHLASPETAATCPVHAGAEHLGWGETPVVASGVPPLHVTAAPILAAEDGKRSLTHRPRSGRAPPA